MTKLENILETILRNRKNKKIKKIKTSQLTKNEKEKRVAENFLREKRTVSLTS